MKATIKIMSTWEAIEPFLREKGLVEDYVDCETYKEIDLTDNLSIQRFLDNDAEDVKRLSRDVCDFLDLDYQDGWYIDTWTKSNYLSKEN